MSAGGGHQGRIGVELLEERIAHLQFLQLVHEEILKLIRRYISAEPCTSEQCLQEIVQFIQKKFDVYGVDIFLMDEVARELVLYVAAGEEDCKPYLKQYRLGLGEGTMGLSAKEEKTLVVHDGADDPGYARGLFPRMQSELCVPIRMRNRLVGVLGLQEKIKNRFTKEFVQLIEHISMNIGFVLENTKLYDDLRRHSEQLEKKVEGKVLELKRSEERYRSMLENVTEPLIVLDRGCHIQWLNRAAVALLGSPREELIGVNVARVVRKGHVHFIHKIFREVMEGREVRGQTLELVLGGGEGCSVELAACAVSENGNIGGMELLLRDVTEKMVIDKLRKNYTQTLEGAVNQRIQEIKDTQRAAILAIANLAESIDDDTGGHIERIQHYARILAEDLREHSPYNDQITEDYIELVYDLSPLHDLGKVGIRDYILQKTDRLSEEEFEIMKTHTEIGARALRMAGEMIHHENLFSIGEMIALFHHEKWDGNGYPAIDINGEFRPLRGEEIPLCARIVALADVYDALTSKRPYKMPFPHEKAREMIVKQSGKHFDPEVVAAFLRREREFIDIRNRFPETLPVVGRPFELPARDRVPETLEASSTAGWRADAS